MNVDNNLGRLVNRIVKEADLSIEDSDMLLHDINNLRGDEWLDIVKKNCSKETYQAFRKLIKK